jgi:hypothetical protein
MSSDAIPPIESPEPNNVLPLARADLGCYAVALYPGFQVLCAFCVRLGTRCS